MKLTAKSEYALRAMVDLARRPGKQTTLSEIAERQNIPAALLPNVIQVLAKAGLVETLRGYGGGVRLGRTAEEINVRMVLEAVDGPLRLYRCRTIRGSCRSGQERRCPLRALWDATQGRILDLWERVSLAVLAESRRGGRSLRKAAKSSANSAGGR